ncbi:MAG: hypothetical protein L6W00_18450 [Lentisphaeria bacterium]|nr:MAG: hypothetical protein L6W00_18450 [Lentisphaeria bacterium]
MLSGVVFAEVGKVIPEEKLVLRGSRGTEEIPLEALLREYKGTLDQI